MVEGHAPVNAVRLAGFRYPPEPEKLLYHARRLARLPHVAAELERLRLLRRDEVVRDAKQALERAENRKLVRLWDKAVVAIDEALDASSPAAVRLRAAELVARMLGMIEPDRHLHLHDAEEPAPLSDEERARLRRIAARVVELPHSPAAPTEAGGAPPPVPAPEG